MQWYIPRSPLYFRDFSILSALQDIFLFKFVNAEAFDRTLPLWWYILNAVVVGATPICQPSNLNFECACSFGVKAVHTIIKLTTAKRESGKNLIKSSGKPRAKLNKFKTIKVRDIRQRKCVTPSDRNKKNV